MTDQRPRVGLVGAGPWAQVFTAPMLAASSGLDLAGVWARRVEAATELAETHGAAPYDTLDGLVADVDALAFAVPPDVQADLATRLAETAKPMLLEKPLAVDLAPARRLVEEFERFDVASMVVFTNRFAPPFTELLDDIESIDPHGASARFIGGGGLPGNPFRTPWRVEHGALLDLGPHVLDVLHAVCGDIVELTAAGDPDTVQHLVCRHRSGATSTASVSITTPGEPGGLVLDVWGRHGRRSAGFDQSDPDATTTTFGTTQTAIGDAFAVVASTRRSHTLDAAHALRIQTLIEEAGRQVP